MYLLRDMGSAFGREKCGVSAKAFGVSYRCVRGWAGCLMHF